MGRTLLFLLGIAILSQTQPAAPSDGLLLVANLREHSLLFVEPRSAKVVASVQVGVSGHEITLSPDKRLAYIPIYSDAVLGDPGNDGRTIDIVDLKARKVTASIDLGRVVRPHRAVFGPDGLLYVTAELANAVFVVDTQKKAVVGEIPTGKPQSHMLALSPDGHRGYTSNVDSGTVSVLDIPARKLLTVIPVTKRIQRIAISSDGRWVFTSDWDSPRVAIIDTRTNTVARWVTVGAVPFAATPTPDGRWLLVAESKADKGQVDVVDLDTMKVAHSYQLPAQPFGFFLHGDLAYMTCIAGGRIEALNLRTWNMEPPLTMTPGVDGMAWFDADL